MTVGVHTLDWNPAVTSFEARALGKPNTPHPHSLTFFFSLLLSSLELNETKVH